MESVEHPVLSVESRGSANCTLKIDRKKESGVRGASTASLPGSHISWPIDRDLEVLSLTPCFSWVKTASKEVGTVSTVSTDCCKPLKRFWRRCHFLTQLKQGVNENRPVFGSRLSINRPPLTGFDSPKSKAAEGQPHSKTLARLAERVDRAKLLDCACPSGALACRRLAVNLC